MKTLCIYHKNCADGIGAAWVVKKELDHVELVAAQYGDPPPDVAGRDVLIVDFSYRRPMLLEMAKSARRITVIDHHKTAEEDLKDIANGIPNLQVYFDMNHSGAVLTWKYFNGTIPAPRILQHIEDRDLWLFKLPKTREIMAGLFSYELSVELIDRYVTIFELIDSLYIDGVALLRQHNLNIDGIIAASKRYMYIGGIRIPVVNAPHYMASDIGSELSKNEPFAATYFDSDGWRNFSLRSQENGEDVSIIAKRYSGGGHKHAAGFKIPLSDIQQFEPL